jgi:hypothetical protein
LLQFVGKPAPSLSADPFVLSCNPIGGCTERVVIDDGWNMGALDGPLVADGCEWHLVQLSPEHPWVGAHGRWIIWLSKDESAV